VSVEEGSIWMTKPNYPKKFLRVAFVEHPCANVVTCYYIEDPVDTLKGSLVTFDIYVSNLKQAYIPYTEAAHVLYGEK
jgi:hypothetical protein